MREHELSANGTGVAPECIDRRVWLASVLQTTEGSLIHAGAFDTVANVNPAAWRAFFNSWISTLTAK